MATLILFASRWHVLQIQSDQQGVLDWQHKRDAQHERADHLDQLVTQLRGQSLGEVQIALNDGLPFLQQRDHKGQRDVIWTDPLSPSTLRFQFAIDRHDEYRLVAHSIQLAPRSRLHPPKRTDQYYFGERIRSSIAGQHTEIGWGPVIWVTLLIAMTVFPRGRWLLKHLLLATAFACLIAWLIHPSHWPGVDRILQNEMLMLGIVMVVASVACHAVVSNGDLNRSRWRSGLRNLLIAAACAAIVLVSGPLGIVLLVVAILCLAEFRLVRRFVSAARL